MMGMRPWMVMACVAPVVALALGSHEVRAWVRGRGSIRQTVSNASVGLLFLLGQLLLRGTLLAIYAGVAAPVPWKWPSQPLFYVLAFLLLDAIYYVQHRLEHAVPLLWAVHSVHHQSQDYNLSVSFRVGALSSLSTLVFHLLLAALGVGVSIYAAVVTVHAVLLFSLHARTRFTLGPGRFFNAPVFHRVHHGADDEYIDKNFGGVFLVFDRACGTFAPYVTDPSFGVRGEVGAADPLSANLLPMARLAEAVRAQPTWAKKLRALFVR